MLVGKLAETTCTSYYCRYVSDNNNIMPLVGHIADCTTGKQCTGCKIHVWLFQCTTGSSHAINLKGGGQTSSKGHPRMQPIRQ
jgi:hypothetical protein